MATDRERPIEALLRRRKVDAPQSTDLCVDAESLAAWMEGGLTADARAAVEKHAAGCARCQALLASMARTEVDIEPRPWWRSLTVKWLVPVAAVATALVVWISVAREPAPPLPPQPSSVDAARRTNIPEPAAVAPSDVPAVSQPATPDAIADKRARQLAHTQDADTRARQELDKMERRRQDGGLAAAQQTKPPAAPTSVAGGAAGGTNDARRPQGQTAADTTARSAASASPPAAAPVAAPGLPFGGLPAPAVPPPPPPATNAAAAEPKPTAVGGVAETVTISREAAAKELAAGRAGAGGGIVGLEIRSPDPTYRWRILPPTGIQRSTDGGTTWAAVDPLPPAAPEGQRTSVQLRVASDRTTIVLTAGSSPSRDVCWIVGRAGVVLLSTNGATWQRRPFPETVDLTAVRASDAKSAVVTAADGRRFATSDGGATWVLMK